MFANFSFRFLGIFFFKIFKFTIVPCKETQNSIFETKFTYFSTKHFTDVLCDSPYKCTAFNFCHDISNSNLYATYKFYHYWLWQKLAWRPMGKILCPVSQKWLAVECRNTNMGCLWPCSIQDHFGVIRCTLFSKRLAIERNRLIVGTRGHWEDAYGIHCIWPCSVQDYFGSFRAVDSKWSITVECNGLTFEPMSKNK